MRGVLTPATALWSFGSPSGFPSSHFGSVSLHPHTLSRLGLWHTYLPPTKPLTYYFFHLPFHQHISNDLVSSPPTYMSTHLSTKWHSYTYLLPIYPTHLPMSYTLHKCGKMLMKLDVGITIHVVPQNDKIGWMYIAFHHVNDYIIFPFYTYYTPFSPIYLLGHQ
jgi:hypothetical protein